MNQISVFAEKGYKDNSGAEETGNQYNPYNDKQRSYHFSNNFEAGNLLLFNSSSYILIARESNMEFIC